MSSPTFQFTREAEVSVLTTDAQRLDRHVAKELAKAFVGAIESGHTRILMDLRGVDFIDSHGLGALVAGLKQMRRVDGQFALFGLQKDVDDMFAATRMDRVFEIYRNMEDAWHNLVT